MKIHMQLIWKILKMCNSCDMKRPLIPLCWAGYIKKHAIALLLLLNELFYFILLNKLMARVLYHY